MNDALTSVSAPRAAQVAFGIIDGLQAVPPAEQVAGAAMLFQALLRRYRLNPREVLPASGRRLEDALTLNTPQTYALREYLNKEI
jgi:hypothetical protein